MNTTKSVLIVSLLCSGNAFAQPVNKEPAAVVELGGAPGWNLTDGGWSFGPTVAVEVTPIENWLELETGVTATFGHHSTEWDTDLLFKKPWKLKHRAALRQLNQRIDEMSLESFPSSDPPSSWAGSEN